MGLFDFLKPKEPENVTISEFECKRGSKIVRGTEYRPQGENLPIAIVSHGFMANRTSVLQYVRVLAEMGYVAYCFDFCGGCVRGGKSDGVTTEMSVLTEVEDLKAVIGYTRSLPYTGDQLILMGCSQGGLVSALTAADLQTVDKLVLFYPALCIPDDARAGRMMFAKFDPANIPEKIRCGFMMLGGVYPRDVINMNPFEAIAPYTGPVRIVHGTKDKVVAPEYSIRAEKAYENADLVMIDKGAHGFNRKHDEIAIAALRDFAAI